MLESYYGAQAYSWYFPFDNFASLNLTQSSPAQTFTEPITVEELCTYLRIGTPTDSDTLNELQALISAAREQAEILQNRDLVTKHWDLTLDYWLPGYRIKLLAPLASVELVQYTDSAGEDHALSAGINADYVVDTTKQPGMIYPPSNKTWPTFTPQPSSSVLIRFTSGYSNTDPFWSDAGARIKIGMKLLISSWWNNRLPFELGSGSAGEYPYAVTSCLSYGALVRAR